MLIMLETNAHQIFRRAGLSLQKKRMESVSMYLDFILSFLKGEAGTINIFSDKPGLQSPESLDVQSEIIKLSIENSWLLAKL